MEFFDGANAFEPKWMTEKEKLEAKAKGIHYMDMSVLHLFIAMLRAQISFRTDTPFLGRSKKQHFSYPSPNSTIVPGIFPHLSTSEPKANLEHFTSYHTRYYDSDTGKTSSEWLYAKILTYTAELASNEQRRLIDIEPVKHAWKQNSIVSHFPLTWRQSITVLARLSV